MTAPCACRNSGTCVLCKDREVARMQGRIRQLEGQLAAAQEQAITMGAQWRSCLPAKHLAAALADFISDTPGLHWILRDLGNADKRTRLLAAFNEYGRP